MNRIGTDIEHIPRFTKLPYNEYVNFYRNVFSTQEIDYCLSRPNPASHFAARFAAKEAIIKAVPLLKTMPLSHIEIERQPTGPIVVLRDPPEPIAAASIRVSLAHSSDYALAVALYEGGTHE